MLKATGTEPNSLTNSIPAVIKKLRICINADPSNSLICRYYLHLNCM